MLIDGRASCEQACVTMTQAVASTQGAMAVHEADVQRTQGMGADQVDRSAARHC